VSADGVAFFVANGDVLERSFPIGRELGRICLVASRAAHRGFGFAFASSGERCRSSGVSPVRLAMRPGREECRIGRLALGHHAGEMDQLR